MIEKESGYKRIFIFWLPLAATWLMMGVEGPFLAAVIARLADAKYNLAAYGIAFSISLIIEAPIIMLMAAGVALVKNRLTYTKMRNFSCVLNVIITVIMLFLLIPQVFYFIAIRIISLPPEVARLAHISTTILLPWPAAIGFRRFYQGVLIANNLTRRVAYATVIRLVSMSLTALYFFFWGNLPGAVVGALALCVGVVVESIAARIMVAGSIRRFMSIHPTDTQNEQADQRFDYTYISKFYFPLAMSSILALGVHPAVTFFMGHSRDPIESLAVLPVINSLTFIFGSLGLSYQEVGIALLGKSSEMYRKIRNFAVVLTLLLVFGLACVAYTPLAVLWFQVVTKLSPELTLFALLPIRITTFLPGLMVILSLQRSVLVNVQNTTPITWATASEVAAIVIALTILIFPMNLVGATAAAVSFILGKTMGNIYLSRPFFRTDQIETISSS